MYDYVVKEVPILLSENFPQLDISRASIFGHSMGGHGALTIYLKNLDKYKVMMTKFTSYELEGVIFQQINRVTEFAL
jgi:S-formylglutathione hydrolase FrmB